MSEKVRRNGLIVVIITLFFIDLFIWQFVIRDEKQEGLLKIAFIDVGQGDSIYLEGPAGFQALIDGGPLDGPIISELGELMPFGDRSIDLIIVTNPDQDHFGGFLHVLDNYEVSKVVEPGTRTTNPLYGEFKETASSKKIDILVPKGGEVFDLGGGAKLEIIFPDRDVSNFSRNDGSIVTRLDYGSTSVMFTGDTTKIIEEYLVAKYKNKLDSDVLKVAHHGSRTSTSKNFVETVSPEYAVISNGSDNSYGHPHKETLDTLNGFRIKIFRIDESGTAKVFSDGSKIYLEKKNKSLISI